MLKVQVSTIEAIFDGFMSLYGFFQITGPHFDLDFTYGYVISDLMIVKYRLIIESLFKLAADGPKSAPKKLNNVGIQSR